MGKFDKFNSQFDTADIRKKIEEAKNNKPEAREVPAGTYEGKFEKMELGTTKDGRPMFKVMFRISKGEFKKHCVFMNRVVYGTKNDMNMIASVEGFVNGLISDDMEPLAFNGNYDDFAEQIMDAAEDIDGVPCVIEYDDSNFNSIHVVDILE